MVYNIYWKQSYIYTIVLFHSSIKFMEKDVYVGEEVRDPKMEFYKLHYPVKRKSLTPKKA